MNYPHGYENAFLSYDNMKVSRLILGIAIALGVLTWVGDAILDALIFYDKPFLSLLVSDVPPHEIYIRTGLLVIFVLFGIITAYLIEQRIEREHELERQNERLEEFASVVSHDLRNPLNVARGRIELAREECDSEHLDDAVSSIDRSFTLIDDMLTLARTGKHASDMEAVNVANLVTAAWGNVETVDATIVADIDATIQADRTRLRQLLENLFRNAVEHAGEDVTVTVGELDHGIYIEDDGPGIPEADREKVFEAGFSTNEEGTGFGLRIVTEIVEAHGWEIRVTESSDGGARFEITGVEFTAG